MARTMVAVKRIVMKLGRLGRMASKRERAVDEGARRALMKCEVGV
jgi:hypothetical protein